jgi:hypothetical protein
MTPQTTAAVAGQVRTVPPEAPYSHDSACYWDVGDCRWQCLIHPLLRYALEHPSANGRPATDTETRP